MPFRWSLRKKNWTPKFLRHLKLVEKPVNMQPWLDLVHRLHIRQVQCASGSRKICAARGRYKSLREALLTWPGSPAEKPSWKWIEARQSIRGDRRGAPAWVRWNSGPRRIRKRGIQHGAHHSYAREHMCHFLAFALACSAPPSNTRVTWPVSKSGQHRVRAANAPSRNLQAARIAGRDEWAAPCAWARGPANWSRIRSRSKAYGKRKSGTPPHRYEFNRDYEKALVGAGLRITGRTPTKITWKLLRRPGTPGSWAASSIRNLNPSRWSRTRFSRPSRRGTRTQAPQESTRQFSRATGSRSRPQPPRFSKRLRIARPLTIQL